MLTPTTTREEFLEQLRSATQNLAVQKHTEKVEAMNDEEWEAHRASLISKTQSPDFQAMKKRIRGELKSQGARFR